tara:strand:- start:136 stop:498 length:363 start_codon:yes stop_codon:yes gene_type:complete
MRVVGIKKAIYDLHAPAPFGKLNITFDSNTDGDVICVSVDSDIGQVKLPKEALRGVRLVGVPEISYNYSKFKKAGSVKEVQVFVEFGEYVELYKGKEYQKRILGFSISDNKKIEVLRLDK